MRAIALALVLAFAGCQQAECEAGKLLGQHESVEFSDATQPWPCGEPPAEAGECILVSERCEWPIVFTCGELTIELTQHALTVQRGECRDEHAVRWR